MTIGGLPPLERRFLSPKAEYFSLNESLYLAPNHENWHFLGFYMLLESSARILIKRTLSAENDHSSFFAFHA